MVIVNDEDAPRELSRLVVPLRGSLEATGDLFVPFRLIGPGGLVVGAAAAFLAELSACGRPATTQRSYGMDLLRWFRFLWAVRSRCLGMAMSAGRVRITTRWICSLGSAAAGIGRKWLSGHRGAFRIRGSTSCSPSSARTGTGRWSRSGCRLGRASEMLGATAAYVDPGQQLITVLRKGTRALQQLPASPDAFVWLRLYQAQLHGLVPAGRDQPLWWTLRQPLRTLSYDAARVMFTRAGAALGANWSLHDLRHTAAYRMARDPQVSLCDVQWVMGHAHLSTTQRYLNPLTEDVVEGVLAFHARRAERGSASPPAAGYRAESLRMLFGKVAV